MKLKCIFTLLFILFFVFSVCNAFAAGKIRGFKNQTGGTADDLDSISVGDLADGDVAFVFSSSYDYFYVYVFNATATNAESSPTYIRPDDYSTQGVWYLTTLSGVTFSSVTIGGFDASIVPQTDASGNLESSAITTTELGYLDGVSSAIQTQINNIYGGIIKSQTPTIDDPDNFTMTGNGMYGGIWIATGASGSPTALPAVAVGMNFTVIVEGAYAVELDPDGTETIYLDGAAESAGETIVSSGTAGDMVVCTYRSAGAWSCNSYGWDGGVD